MASPVARLLVRHFGMVSGAALVLASALACTQSGSKLSQSSLSLTLPDFKSLAADEKVAAKSEKKQNDASSSPTITPTRIMINVTGPGIPTPIVSIWQAAYLGDTPPTTVSLQVPPGSGRLIQVLITLASSTTNLTVPYNCSAQYPSTTPAFYYGDAAVTLVSGTQSVGFNVAPLAITQGLEGNVTGRFLPNAGSLRGPTGHLSLIAAIPGKPSMIVDTNEVFDGWFSAYAIEGIAFNYVIEGQDVLGQSLDLANAPSFLAKGSSATNALVIKTATGWTPIGSSGGLCGGQTVAAKKILIGTFGAGAAGMPVCAPPSSTLGLFNSYAYSSPTFTFTNPTSWNATSTNATDAFVVYPAGAVGVGTEGLGTCGKGVDLVDKLTFSSAPLGGSGGNLSPSYGPFSVLSGGLNAVANANGYNLSWNYLGNMSSLLDSADVFVRTGVYANGSATSSQGQSNYTDANSNYMCANLTNLGFTLAGSAGKDSSGNLISSFALSGINASFMSGNMVQVVVCPRLAGAYTESALSCGDNYPCGTTTTASTVQPTPAPTPIASATLSQVTSVHAIITAGSTTAVTLTVNSTTGAPYPLGGANVVFTVSGGTASGNFSTVVDNGNGTYSSVFTGTQSGTGSLIGATLNGTPVGSVLPAVTVLPGLASVSGSTLTVSKSVIVAGKISVVTLQARDAFGNKITTGGQTVVFTLASGSSILTVGPTTDNNDGTYKANLTGVSAGTPTAINALIAASLVTSGTPTVAVIAAIHRVAYVANATAGTISMYSVNNATGILAAHPVPTVSAGLQTVSVNVDPSGRFAYAVNSGDKTISMYTIDADTGALSAMTPATISTGPTAPVNLTIDPAGRFAYLSSGLGNTVLVYSINGVTGQLSLSSSLPVGVPIQSVSIDPSGRFAYIVPGANTLFPCMISPVDGSLTPDASVATGSAPVGVTIDPTGRFAYAANSGSGTISMYSINLTTGALTPLSTATVSAGSAPSSVVFDVTGRYAYVTDSGNAKVFMYSMAEGTGILAPLSPPSIGAGNGAQALTLDPSGRFLYAVNRTDSTTSMYSINEATGLLTSLGSPLATGLSPSSIATTAGPSRFSYTTAITSFVSMYSIDPAGGQLTALAPPTAVSGAYPYSAVADPSGRFLYTANSVSNTVSMFAIDQILGQLTAISPGVVSTGVNPQSMAVDPTGRFAYTANNSAGTISQFAINPSTGLLTPVGSAITTTSQPWTITVDRTGRFVYEASYLGVISMYSINQATGSLTPLSIPTINSDSASVSITMAQSGRFVYVANRAGTITSYSVNLVNGELTATSPASIGGLSDPYCFALDPSGRFAFTANESGNSVGMYTVDQAGGMLTNDGSPLSTGATTYPQVITIDGAGRFAYVVLNNTGAILMYSMNRDSGLLSPLATPSITTAGYPTSIITTH